MLNTGVLVLNKSYFPVHVTTVRRAFSLLYSGIAKAVDTSYTTFDFESWSELATATHDDTIGMVGRAMRVPRVILLVGYDRVPKRRVKFNRINIYLRDKNRCQYCGKKFNRRDLNLDHVIPRSRGGHTSWENVVSSCFDCNCTKGGRTPREAGMKLLTHPTRPAPGSLGQLIPSARYEEWKPFLNIVDASYWQLELKDE